MTHIYSTNKTLLKISMKQPFWEIRNLSFPEFPPASESSMSKNIGYYLADRIVGTGSQQQHTDATIDAVAPKIFRQELAEAGVDESLWPDTDNVTLFRDFFHVEKLALIADFGEEPVISTRVK